MSDASAPAGWYDDPTRRHQRRYFDGTKWTDHVANGSAVETDPMRSSVHEQAVDAPRMLAGPPTSATSGGLSAPAAVADNPPVGVGSSNPSFPESLGHDARTRSDPDFPKAMGGIGGLLVGLGLVALIAQSGDQIAVALAGVGTLAAALGVVLFLVPKYGFLTSPAVSVAVVGIFTTAIGLIVADDGPYGPIGTDGPFQVLLVGGSLCVIAWAAPGFRGRPFLLGVGLVAIPIALAGMVAGGQSCNTFDTNCNAFEAAAGSAGLSSGAGVVLAVIGCAMLILVRKLDAIGRPGVATTVAAACIVDLVVGSFLLAGDLGSTGGPLLVAVTGVALGVVGHFGRRRGLTWTGAALAAGGVVAAVADLVDTDSNTVGGIVAVLTGAVVIGAPYAVVTLTGDHRSHAPPPTDEE